MQGFGPGRSRVAGNGNAKARESPTAPDPDRQENAPIVLFYPFLNACDDFSRRLINGPGLDLFVLLDGGCHGARSDSNKTPCPAVVGIQNE